MTVLRFNPFGGLEATYDMFILGSLRMADFLLELTELFAIGFTAEAIYGRISIENRRFRSNRASLIQNFRYN